jgi:RNA polymerase sigma factor (sigma-70 family)
MSSDRPDALRHLRRIIADPQHRGIADADLVQRFVLQHDEAAFELLVRRHAGMVLGTCRAILRDYHLAEDAFQATFLTLARKAGSIGQRNAVAGWLYRVAQHAALKARARKARDAAQSLTAEPVAASPPAEDDMTFVLHEELGRLPEKYRLPLVLCFLEGQSHADAARQLGWPKGTVAGRIARARDILRKRLTRRGEVLPAALSGTGLAAATHSAIPPILVPATVQASLAFLSGDTSAVSIPVLRLSEGALRAMFLSKFTSVAVAACVVVCALLGGLGTLALAQKPSDPSPPSRSAVDSGTPPRKAEDPKDLQKLKDRSILNLKQIGLAVHNYHSVFNHLPNNILGADKKPLLSWRVQLLPYLEHNDLYREFKLDEPWDSEHNLKLLRKIPDVYRTGTEARGSHGTYYQGLAGADTVFPPGQQLSLADITDGTANTILAVEGGTPVPWTKPVDIPYAADKPLPKLGGVFKDVIHTVLVDGSVFAMKRDCDENLLRLAITRNDNQELDILKLRAYDLPPPKVERFLFPWEAARIAEARARAEAEAMAARAQEAMQRADQARSEAEMLKKAQEKVKEALRDIGAQLEKLDKKPTSDDVKGLREELERTRAELRFLRDKVKRLEQSVAK